MHFIWDLKYYLFCLEIFYELVKKKYILQWLARILCKYFLSLSKLSCNLTLKIVAVFWLGAQNCDVNGVLIYPVNYRVYISLYILMFCKMDVLRFRAYIFTIVISFVSYLLYQNIVTFFALSTLSLKASFSTGIFWILDSICL